MHERAGPATGAGSTSLASLQVNRDEARAAVANRELTPLAVTHLTRDALGTIDFAVLAPVKQLLKRFFSGEPWSADDDRALAELVGPGRGWWRYDLDDDLTLQFGWRHDAFKLDAGARGWLGETFDGPVTPEATPNPRSIRFVTGSIHDGPSRWYESAEQVDDARAARLFADFDAVTNVLVGPDFVAVGLRHPDDWEALLEPVLRTVTEEFAAGDRDASQPASQAGSRAATTTGGTEDATRSNRALDRAWSELGALRADNPAGLEQILAASESDDGAHRQVAARLLIGADPGEAARAWERLGADEVRSVRRATVDAMVDAERESLRGLLERALADPDPWTRWKALRGLVDLGIEPSSSLVSELAADPDFRVRLEAAGALRVHG